VVVRAGSAGGVEEIVGRHWPLGVPTSSLVSCVVSCVLDLLPLSSLFSLLSGETELRSCDKTDRCGRPTLMMGMSRRGSVEKRCEGERRGEMFWAPSVGSTTPTVMCLASGMASMAGGRICPFRRGTRGGKVRA
jgi:hypothetical protein